MANRGHLLVGKTRGQTKNFAANMTTISGQLRKFGKVEKFIEKMLSKVYKTYIALKAMIE